MKKKKIKSLISPLKIRWWLIDEENSISYKIIRKSTEILCFLPKSIRKIVFSFLDNFIILMSRFFKITSQVSLTAYLVKGKEKHSGENLSIFLIGDERIYPYISSILFLEEPKIEKRYKIHIWNYKKKLNQIQPDIDAVFIKSDRFYSRFFEKQGFTIIPEWISTTLDISEPLENVYKKFSKGAIEDIRKIKKYGYNYEVSQDPDKLKMFYHKMYLPYISWKYGKLGTYPNFYTIKHLIEQGSKLLFIKLKDEYLFGGIFLKNKDKVFATYAGVMEGKFDCIQQGVIAASYHYLIQHSKEIGANTIDFGNCRPFVNDGVFQYKRKWGTSIDKAGNENADIYSFKASNNSKGFSNFLIKNPFISLEKNQLNTETCEKNNKIL